MIAASVFIGSSSIFSRVSSSTIMASVSASCLSKRAARYSAICRLSSALSDSITAAYSARFACASLLYFRKHLKFCRSFASVSSIYFLRAYISASRPPSDQACALIRSTSGTGLSSRYRSSGNYMIITFR